MNETKLSEFSPIAVTNAHVVNDNSGGNMIDRCSCRVRRRARPSDVERVVWIARRHHRDLAGRRQTLRDELTVGVQLESRLGVPRYLDEIPVVHLDAMPQGLYE